MPRRLCLLVAVIAAGLCLSSAAQADVGLVPPGGGLAPVDSSAPAGTVSPMSTPQSGVVQCTGSYSSTVSNVPSGYAIGNCLNGVHLDRTVKSDLVSSPPGYFDGGFIHGNYNGCGWVGTDWDAMLYDQTNNPCSDSASHGQAEFMYYENGHYIINDESASDGTPLQTTRDCTEYANFRPWSATPAESDAIRTVPAGDTVNGQWRLRWRWLTARRSTLTNAYFYMVRDTAAPPGNGNWVFVSQACFN